MTEGTSTYKLHLGTIRETANGYRDRRYAERCIQVVVPKCLELSSSDIKDLQQMFSETLESTVRSK